MKIGMFVVIKPKIIFRANYNDLTVLTGIIVNKRNHLRRRHYFRLVKYYNLPR